jgi:hypothetical protein
MELELCQSIDRLLAIIKNARRDVTLILNACLAELGAWILWLFTACLSRSKALRPFVFYACLA